MQQAVRPQAESRRARNAARAAQLESESGEEQEQELGSESGEEEEEEEEEERERGGDYLSPRNVRHRLMRIRELDPTTEEGGAYNFRQNADQKRAVRKETRDVIAYIQANRVELANPDDKRIGDALIAGEALSALAKQPRETTLVNELMHAISQIMNEKTHNVKTSFRNRDPYHFLNSMKKYMQKVPRPDQDFGSISTQYSQFASSKRALGAEARDLQDKLNWAQLAKDIIQGGFTRATFSPDCMYGPLEHPPPPRAVPQARRKDPELQAAATKPEEITTNAQLENTSEKKTEEWVQRLAKHHRHAMKKNGDKPLDFWGFVLDTESFTQTVENVFHFAFLVRDGKAILSDAGLQTGLPGQILTEYDEKGRGGQTHEDHDRRQQAVIQLDFPKWRSLCEIYKNQPQRLHVPHRDYGAASALKRTAPANADDASQGATKRKR